MRSLFSAVSLLAVTVGLSGTVSAQAARPRPNPYLQDSIRVATIAEVLKSVEGRENEPAGKVFKNVLLFKDMPVKDFLKKMDEDYGRALGAVCTGCHVAKEWDKDDKKNKTITRDMEKMTRIINETYLAKQPDIDEDYPKATCVMCHRGTAHMPNTMPKPTRDTPPAEQRARQAPPPPPPASFRSVYH
jgi:hypothetical protein